MARLHTLLGDPLAAMRRAVVWWSIGLAGLVAATVGFWPAFQGTSGISQAIDQLPAGVVAAFGLQDFGTPAGYLRGNLYEFFIPLLLVAAGAALVSGQTAGEESNGRLELVLAQPVSRRAVYLSRVVAALGAFAVIVAAVTLVQLAIDAVVGLRIGTDVLLATIVLSALLGWLFASVAFLVATIRPSPGLVVSLAVGLAVASYVVAVLFPMSDVLAPWRHLSPWDWAFGGDPLEQPTEPWRYMALVAPSLASTVVGWYAVAKRDVAAP